MNFENSRSRVYHELTKHSLESLYSRAGGGLDWEQQPDPFRVYQGSQKILLSRKLEPQQIGLFRCIKQQVLASACLVQQDRSDLRGEEFAGGIESEKFLSELLYFSMAISAWKQIRGTNHKWALRVNPSSGNLHPTELHLLSKNFPGIENGAYHYLVKEHALELRAKGEHVDMLSELLSMPELGDSPLVLVLSSIFWREAWKYRDRAYRYCHLDLGHAAAALSLSASARSFACRLIGEFPDRQMQELLGLDDSDEKTMLIIPLYPFSKIPISDKSASKQAVLRSSAGKQLDLPELDYRGKANKLSDRPLTYESINQVYEAGIIGPDQYKSRKDYISRAGNLRPLLLESRKEEIDLTEFLHETADNLPCDLVFRRRRSAVDMDGKLRISAARLAAVLVNSTRLIAADFFQAYDFEAGKEQALSFIHLLLYVHRVDGIESGVYYFDPCLLKLHCIQSGNLSSFARYVSCIQDIAADGVFAVSLVADMDESFRRFSERAYRYVHQEAGFIGQHFYLTAKALDIDATGIGCFLDDEINSLLPAGFQTVYNFTFGRAVLDPRLSDLPAYDFAEAT